MALTPRIQHLSSPLEDKAELPQEWEETAGVESLSGSPVTRWLYRWAEYHQGKFGEKTSQQGLTPIDVGIVHGETLQAGSDTREYQGFMEFLEARAARTPLRDTLGGTPFPIWLAQMGMGCTLMSVCWIGGQLCYNGLIAIRNQEVNSGLGEFWVTLCCGHSSLQREKRDNVMRKQWMELNDSMQPRRDHVEGGIAWVGEGLDTCEEVGMIMTGELEEMDDDLANQDHQPEKRQRSQKV